MRSAMRFLAAAAVVLTWQVSALASSVWQVNFTLTVQQQFEPTDPTPAPGSFVQPSVGEQFFGQIIYTDEDLAGVGSEHMLMLYYKDPSFTVSKFGILSMTLDYYTDQVSAKDAEVSPWLPIIYFQDGVFQSLYFAGDGRLGDFDIRDDKFDIYLNLPTEWGHLASGSVSYSSPMAIPTPAAAGAGLALLTVLGLKRRRRAA